MTLQVVNRGDAGLVIEPAVAGEAATAARVELLDAEHDLSPAPPDGKLRCPARSVVLATFS